VQLVVGFVCSEVEVLVEREQHVAVGLVRWAHVGLQGRHARCPLCCLYLVGWGGGASYVPRQNPITPATKGVFIYLNIPKSPKTASDAWHHPRAEY
jgi:hypothetical protein